MKTALVGVGLALASLAGAQDRTLASDADVQMVVFSKDGGKVMALCADRKLRRWDARTGAPGSSSAWKETERAVAVLPHLGAFALAANDGSLALADLETGAAGQRFSTGGKRLGRVAMAPDKSAIAASSRVAGNSREEVMRLWDAAGRERFAVASGIGGTSTSAISPDGGTLAAGSFDTNVRIWSTRNGELVRLIEELPVSMFAMAFTPDGRRLAAAGVDGTVYFWDAKTWKLERKLTGQPEMISALAFSADGKRLATGGFHEITLKHPVSILIWDVASGKVVQKLAAPHRVVSVAFSPDGRTLAASSGDKSVRLWQVRAGN